MPKGSEELTNARKEEIINACASLYETVSFKDITIRDIGAATSFSRTSIYNYFQTKEEIFLALLQREHELWIADLEELIRQIKYIVRVGGEDCLALGSDFDGIEEAPEMENGGGMGTLAEAMESAGISHDLTEKIFWKNADRFFKENL